MEIKNIFANFEKAISFILVILMVIVVISATLELGVTLFKSLTENPGIFLGLAQLFDIFGMFMLVLIAIELMSSIYVYCTDKVVYLEMMFLIAITAVTRKIVVLDAKAIDPLTVIGIAFVLAALVAGYYVVKKTAVYKSLMNLYVLFSKALNAPESSTVNIPLWTIPL